MTNIPPKDTSFFVKKLPISQCEHNKVQYQVLPAAMSPKLGLAEIHEGSIKHVNA